MTDELFIKIVGSLLTIMCALITTFVIPWIKSKINAEDMAKIENYAKMAVRCAEQIYPTEEYLKKKEYVLDCVVDYINKNINLTLSTNDLDILIESAVNEIKYSGDYKR